MNENHKTEGKKRSNFFSVVQSVLAAFIGVQSEEKRKEDFEKGSAAEFIFAGIIGTIIFISLVMWMVNSIISDYNAGG
ncbi:DUF2970 domain-containing protein [Pleionea sp. CnH1-48]|uniref:DUF2970 domain-containing protein n=1 Tax=Pleionea sp. CnH1-48 TaxID=2954494 RepID=UPI002097FFD3|nr:DUF2970 domain-containing protein [Pleionea sp. CnH1-48]MCO7225716.1 DUF2970 domain-containing protein [Pleionea sp. CnH1-48]